MPGQYRKQADSCEPDELTSLQPGADGKEATIQSANASEPSARAKYFVLFLLLAHNVVIVIMMRQSQTTTAGTAHKKRYLATSAVFVAEVFKMITAFALVAWEEKGASQAMRVCYDACTTDHREMLRLSVPSFLYAVQNNLLFVALAHLPAAVYSVAYQMKILTTALFSVVILGRSLSALQWISLVMLTYGVALMQSGSRSAHSDAGGNMFVGFVAVIFACITSSFAGVYMEKLLKKTDASLWLRNVQLAAIGSPVTLAAVFWCDGDRVQEAGLLQGFDSMVWSIVIINALGGLVIAAVLRYADNIIKCFASAAAIVCVCVISDFDGDYMFDMTKTIGTCCVIGASVLFGLGLPSWLSVLWWTGDNSFGVLGVVLIGAIVTLLWSVLPVTQYGTMMTILVEDNVSKPFMHHHGMREHAHGFLHA